VEITFEDNGIGFDQQFSQQIFQIFQRLHRNEQFEGTGIGLALCKKIVSNHHGDISAESKEGKGAGFRVVLPLEQ
jgi:light-regulated signal transduction histidine kinase (bacteriophytochrome)